MSLMQRINESQAAIVELKDIEIGGCGDTDIDKLSIAEENNSDRAQRIIDPMSQPAKIEMPVQPDPQASVPPSSDLMMGTHKKEDDQMAMIFDPMNKEVYFGQSHSMSEQQRKSHFSSLKKPQNNSPLHKKSTISLNFDHEHDKTGAPTPTSDGNDPSSDLLRMCLTS